MMMVWMGALLILLLALGPELVRILPSSHAESPSENNYYDDGSSDELPPAEEPRVVRQQEAWIEAHGSVNVHDEDGPITTSSSSRTTGEASTATTSSQYDSSSSTTTSTSALYGVDVSWPMQHRRLEVMTRLKRPQQQGVTLDDSNTMESQYLHYMQGCQERYDIEICEEYERDRIEMNLKQPPVMINYTNAGYAKLKTPMALMNLLTLFWHDHYDDDTKDDDDEREEVYEEDGSKVVRIEPWPRGNIYTNHWKCPTRILPLVDHPNQTTTTTTTTSPPRQNPFVLPIGADLVRRKLVEHVAPILEAWTGQPLTPTSIYGIRIYQQGAILAPHVDRLPLVTSAIINVAQDVDEPWILELIGHDGKANNVTMQPGDMVLYESHSVIHGRPYPLKGRFYANVFIHFEPIGYTQRHAQRAQQAGPMSDTTDVAAQKLWQEALTKELGSSSSSGSSRSESRMPHYIQEKSREETRWRQLFAFQRDEMVILDGIKKKKKVPSVKSDIPVHTAAALGDLDRVKELASKNRYELFKKDENGWQPIHEAARAGQTHVLEYLIREGANIDQRTNNGIGATPRWWAEQSLPADHATVQLLQQLNALKQGPMENVETDSTSTDDEKEKSQEAK